MWDIHEKTAGYTIPDKTFLSLSPHKEIEQ